jgi:RNA polymerase sigma factor (sigma-70 family)
MLDCIRKADWVPRLVRRQKHGLVEPVRMMAISEAAYKLPGGEQIDALESFGTLEQVDLKEDVAVILLGLNRKQRLLLIMYYLQQRTMAEVGLALGMSESRVSQLHDETLAFLRAKASRPGEE